MVLLIKTRSILRVLVNKLSSRMSYLKGIVTKKINTDSFPHCITGKTGDSSPVNSSRSARRPFTAIVGVLMSGSPMAANKTVVKEDHIACIDPPKVPKWDPK